MLVYATPNTFMPVFFKVFVNFVKGKKIYMRMFMLEHKFCRKKKV